MASETVRKQLKWSAVVLGVLFLLAQLYRPARTNPVAPPEQHLRVHAQPPAEVMRIFDRSCRDCHSNQTVWPWYSHVAPVSWIVIDDVNHARSHMNLSQWAGYSARKQDDLLEDICDEVREEEMPLASYTWVHKGTRLTSEEVDTLCRWTEAERQRLAAKSGTPDPEKKDHHDHEH